MADDEATSLDLADALWLIHQIGYRSVPSERPPAPLVRSVPEVRAAPSPKTPLSLIVPPEQWFPPDTGIELHLARPSLTTFGQRPASAVQLAQTSVLGNKSALVRALRPLKRRVPAPTRLVVNDSATIQASAEAGTLLPKLQPAEERWLELAVVADDSASMAIWQPTIQALLDLVTQYGIFRDVHAWRMNGDDGPSISPLHSQVSDRRSPAQLHDPSGRRLIIVLTDGVGRAWREPKLPAALQGWRRYGSLLLIHLLPRHLWHRTALNPDSAYIRRGTSTRVEVTVQPGRRRAHTRESWVPIIALEPRSLAQWASIVAGTRTGWAATAAISLTALAEAPIQPPALSHANNVRDLVTRFKAEASPKAFMLACLLSPAPLTLPLMRWIQAVWLPSSGPSHLAEIFLSGLVGVSRGTEAVRAPDDRLYDFMEGVRAELITFLTRAEALSVLESLSAAPKSLGTRFGGLDLRALVPDWSGQAILSRDSIPFARIAITVLRSLGNAHAELARQIAEAADPSSPETAEERVDLRRIIGTGHSDQAPRAMVELGILEAGQGNTEIARRWYQQAVDTGHSDQAPRAMVQLGILEAGQGNTEIARRWYQQAVDTGHSDQAPRAMVQLGILEAGQGNTEIARRWYQQAVDTGHSDQAPRAMVELGILEAGQGNTEIARRWYQQAVDTGHSDQAPRAMVQLGILEAGQGNTEIARRWYQQAVDTGHSRHRVPAMVNLGILEAGRGNTEAANRLYEEAVAAGYPEVLPPRPGGGLEAE